MYTIGQVSDMFDIPASTLRYYDKEGLFPGITRKSIVEMLKNEGYKVEERLLSVDELAQSMADGTLEEAWGCGTAAVVSPIGELCYKDKVYIVNEGKIGELTQHLYDTLTGIQWGKTEDTYNWTYKI